MSWLVGRSSHAHGLSQPSYLKIVDPAGEKEIEAAKEMMIEYDLWPDRDGFRKPVFEVIEHLPKAILERKIRDAENELKSHETWLTILRSEKGV